MSDEDYRTVWAGNLSDQTTEEVLHELFLQAGPLQYIRQPKDKTTGKKKNFAFVCYRHECSVSYAIALLNEIKLFGRNLRVQSRHLQELQAQGLASYEPGGIHTLSPFEDESPSHNVSQGCRQQAPLMEQPSSLLGNVPPHIIALAQQQMAMLNAHQPMPLSVNPSLNARMRPRDDRYGSLNYGRNNPNSGGYSHGSNNYDRNNPSYGGYSQGSTNYDRNSPNSGGHSHQGYSRHQDNRSRRPPRHDNQSMQAMKARFEDSVSQNSQMLTTLQDRQGRFDVNRLDSRGNNYDNRYQQDRDGHHRSSNRDYRQQPYDRHESQHSRNHDRHSSYDSHRRYDDKGSSSHRSSNDRHDRGYRNSSYDSRR